MTKKDIDTFIAIMKDVCIEMTPEEVEEKYGDCATLKDAINRRLTAINTFWDYVEEVVQPEAEELGLWPKGITVPRATGIDDLPD